MTASRNPAPPEASRSERLRLVDDLTHQRLVEGYRRMLPCPSGLERHLAGVLDDTLEHPGSLIRAQLAHSTLRELGGGEEPATDVAIALEYFHAASLLFDDMPAMDDARERRGHPCPHVVHGEAATTLAALGLINQGYALAWRALAAAPEARRVRGAELLTECLGVSGILDGQSRDVHFSEGPRTLQRALDAAAGKTVPLIRLTLVLPAMVAGAGDATLARLERLAWAWGLAYQVIDDFQDRLRADAEMGKPCGRDGVLGRPNVALTAGDRPALEQLDGLLADAAILLDELRAGGSEWAHLTQLHGVLCDERASISRRLSAAA